MRGPRAEAQVERTGPTLAYRALPARGEVAHGVVREYEGVQVEGLQVVGLAVLGNRGDCDRAAAERAVQGEARAVGVDVVGHEAGPGALCRCSASGSLRRRASIPHGYQYLLLDVGARRLLAPVENVVEEYYAAYYTLLAIQTRRRNIGNTTAADQEQGPLESISQMKLWTTKE